MITYEDMKIKYSEIWWRCVRQKFARVSEKLATSIFRLYTSA